MGRKLHFSFTKITVDELYLWLKKKLSKGFFPKFQDFSDEEVLKLALVCHPYISEKLDIAERLALIQLENKLSKKDERNSK